MEEKLLAQDLILITVKKRLYVWYITLYVLASLCIWKCVTFLKNGTCFGHNQPVKTFPFTLSARGSSLCDFKVKTSESTSEGSIKSKSDVLCCHNVVKYGQIYFSAKILTLHFAMQVCNTFITPHENKTSNDVSLFKLCITNQENTIPFECVSIHVYMEYS